jgi:sugar phosphate isomerase/epimerase
LDSLADGCPHSIASGPRAGITTFGYLYRAPLEQSLESIARAGYSTVEIVPAPPHIALEGFDRGRRKSLTKLLRDLHLTCVSITPIELNLISTNPDLRRVAIEQYRRCIALAHDLAASIVVVVAGRQNPLVPMPRADALKMAADQIFAITDGARELGITLAIETVPFGLTETAADVIALLTTIGDKQLAVALDVANMLGKDESSAAVVKAASHLCLAHLSDSWRGRWAHTSIGRGEVDLRGFVQALQNISFSGPCIYELADGEDPEPRIAADLLTLRAWGMTA